MPKMSNLLKVYKTKHPKLGPTIVLYSPAGEKGDAYFIKEEQVSNENGVEWATSGVGLRLTYETAAKLGKALLKMSKQPKGKKS
jgi:hypothetical protein